MKRFFIMPYLIILALASVYGLYEFFASHWKIEWLLLTLSCLPMLIFIARLSTSGRARTRDHLYPEMGFGAIATLWVYWQGHSNVALAMFLLSVVGVFLYDFWYSDLSRVPPRKLLKGEPLPAFSLATLDDGVFHSQDHTNKPAVWMFIRGNWCPLCVAQVEEMAENYRKLDEQGVSVFVISAQPLEQTQKLASRFKVPMTFLIDKEGNAAKHLGLWQPGGVPVGIPGYGTDTTLPTVLVTGDDGLIYYSGQFSSYRIRPEPEDFLAALERAD